VKLETRSTPGTRALADFDPISRKVFAEAARPVGEGFFWRYDGPTWLVAIGTYAAWALLVIYHDLIPWPLKPSCASCRNMRA
jgi:hypothetical protein